MIQINNKIDCCGCKACGVVCPKGAISFSNDNEGFWYPNVNLEACINCHLCEKVCPELHPNEERLPLRTMAAYYDNKAIVRGSSSGGIFSLLSHIVFSKGGVVFGASFNSTWQVVIDYVESDKDIAKFRKSKYVQADTSDSYLKVKQFLLSGRIVLFTGTSCQISGLKSYLRKDYDNLITAEVACHGVPSPLVWEKHLNQVIECHSNGHNLFSVDFRYKAEGWKGYRLHYVFDDGSEWDQCRDDDPYMRGFVRSLYSRTCCENCRFKGGRSNADFLLGDLWGSEIVCPSIDNNNGVSLVAWYSKKATLLLPPPKFDKMGSLISSPHETEKSWLMTGVDIRMTHEMQFNEGLHSIVPHHGKRNVFFRRLLKSKNVDKLIESCLQPSFLERVECQCHYFCHFLKSKIVAFLS